MLLLIVLIVLSLSNLQFLSERAIEQNEQDKSQLLSLLRRASQILLSSAGPSKYSLPRAMVVRLTPIPMPVWPAG